MAHNVVNLRSSIAMLLAVGYTNKEIGVKLGLSASTVGYHVKKLRDMAADLGNDENAFYSVVFGYTGKFDVHVHIDIVRRVNIE